MRCHRRTLNGLRCKRDVNINSRYCWQHVRRRPSRRITSRNTINKGITNKGITNKGIASELRINRQSGGARGRLMKLYWQKFATYLLRHYPVDMIKGIEPEYNYYDFRTFANYFPIIDLINPIFADNYILHRPPPQFNPGEKGYALVFGDGNLTQKHLDLYPPEYIEAHQHIGEFTVDVDPIRNPTMVYVMGVDPQLPDILLTLPIHTIIFEGFFLYDPIPEMPFFFLNIYHLLKAHDMNFIFMADAGSDNNVAPEAKPIHRDFIQEQAEIEYQMRREQMSQTPQRMIDYQDIFVKPLAELVR